MLLKWLVRNKISINVKIIFITVSIFKLDQFSSSKLKCKLNEKYKRYSKNSKTSLLSKWMLIVLQLENYYSLMKSVMKHSFKWIFTFLHTLPEEFRSESRVDLIAHSMLYINQKRYLWNSSGNKWGDVK